MSTFPIKTILNDADLLLKSGRISEVREQLQLIKINQISREDLQAFARTARRTGLITLGLRALKPLIHPEELLQKPATGGEMAEYAVLLSRVGAINEALKLLEKVDEHSTPETLLYRGFCHVSDWNYEDARSAFEKHLLKIKDPYSQLISRVNLGACLVYCEAYPEALELLTETIELAKVARALRLEANCLELRGQTYLQLRHFEKAKTDFERAGSIFGELKLADQLLVQKGFVILDAEQHGTIEPLLKFRKLSVEKQSWENVRETDFLILQKKFDPGLFQELFFGTPYSSFKNRMIRHFKLPPPPQSLRGSGESVLDLKASSFPRKVRQALLTLTSDSYSPVSSGRLFSEIYPDEYFDVHSSPIKVRQALTRARAWLSENGFNISIENLNGGSVLKVPESDSILIPESHGSEDPNWQKCDLLFERLSTRAFRPQEACEFLNVSRSVFNRWAVWAREQKLLALHGSGPSIQYSFEQSLTAVAAVSRHRRSS